jgi:uncharacterized membrane protein YkoI
MKKYKVTASYITYCTAEVEAEDRDQAYEMARDMDGGDFTQSRDNYDWHISDIQEVAP